MPKNVRAHKKPVKAEFRSIPERFAQHCWDEGGGEHRRSMPAEFEHHGSTAALSAATCTKCFRGCGFGSFRQRIRRNGMSRWIDMEPDDIGRVVDELGIVGGLSRRTR